MSYTLQEVFNQANSDNNIAKIESKCCDSVISKGVKIERDINTGEIVIYNTHLGGDFYKEIESNEYLFFEEKGWIYGKYVVSLSNYRRKLDVIEQRIRAEINTRKNGRYIMGLKDMREHYLLKFSQSSKIINKLN